MKKRKKPHRDNPAKETKKAEKFKGTSSTSALSDSSLRHLVFAAQALQAPQDSSGGPPPPDPCAAQAAALSAAQAALPPLQSQLPALQAAHTAAQNAVGDANILYSAALLLATNTCRTGNPIACASAVAAAGVALINLQLASRKEEEAWNALRKVEDSIRRAQYAITRAEMALAACRLAHP